MRRFTFTIILQDFFLLTHRKLRFKAKIEVNNNHRRLHIWKFFRIILLFSDQFTCVHKQYLVIQTAPRLKKKSLSVVTWHIPLLARHLLCDRAASAFASKVYTERFRNDDTNILSNIVRIYNELYTSENNLCLWFMYG